MIFEIEEERRWILSLMLVDWLYVCYEVLLFGLSIKYSGGDFSVKLVKW